MSSKRILMITGDFTEDYETMVPFQALMYKNITLRPFAIFGMPVEAQDAAFTHIERLLADATLSHLVGSRFAFDQMIEAHEAIETGDAFGAHVVRVG